MSTDDVGTFISYEQDGETWYFCSNHCLEKFKGARADVDDGHGEKKTAP